MFDMDDKEYETLQQEFEIILKQMDLIEKMEGIKEVEPMTFPFPLTHVKWRKDEVTEELTKEEILQNTEAIDKDQVRVPKVVE